MMRDSQNHFRRGLTRLSSGSLPEQRPLVHRAMSGRRAEGLFGRCLRRLDEHTNVKPLLRVWGPRVHFFVRLLVIGTFIDDSLRCAMHFKVHVRQVGEHGYLRQIAETSPDLIDGLAAVFLTLGLFAQSVGSVCLLTLVQPEAAIVALMAWTIAQPVLYAQLANAHYVATSLALFGGLLILRAHLRSSDRASSSSRRAPVGGGALCGASCGSETAEEEEVRAAAVARMQLLGRLLLVGPYVLQAGAIAQADLSASLAAERHRAAHSASMYGVDALVLVALLLGGALVAAGLRSRVVALTLALANGAYSLFVLHPLWAFASPPSGGRGASGEWTYHEGAMRASMPRLALPPDLSESDFEPWLLYDLHRYYLFHSLSTSGALLALAHVGPGEIALEEDEILLGDAQRAVD